LAKATPTAGDRPGLKAKKLQPYKTQSTYNPFIKHIATGFGNIALSSQLNSAITVITPVSTHMAISHPAEPTWRTISELTINIPEPIMDLRPAWFHQIILVLF
jgi:hypothetical protein